MQTVILAGGMGKRVFPLASDMPKPMYEVLGKPLIQHLVESLKDSGFKHLVIITGRGGEQIRNHFLDGSRFGVGVDYAVQKNALGMANALEAAKDLVEDTFLVVNADDILERALLERIRKQHKDSGAGIALSCKPVTETWKFGIVQMEGDRVTKLLEKPAKGEEPSNLAVVGAYILTRDIFSHFKHVPVSDHQFEDAIQRFIDEGNLVTATVYNGFFAGFKFPWDLFAINKHLMDTHLKEPKIEADVDISAKSMVEGPVWIKQGSKILEGACIRGPCYIGADSFVGNNCLIWNYSSIGNHCVVGFSTEIKHSLIGDNCWFHTNYIGDSIVSSGCNFGAGTITANFRFDEKNIKVKVEEEIIDSGLDKLGAIIGKDCKTGINACLAPGVTVGPHSIVGPSVNLQENLAPDKIIFKDKGDYIEKENKIAPVFEKKHGQIKKLMKLRGDE